MPAGGYNEVQAGDGTPLVIRRADRAPLGGLLLVIAALWLAAAIGGLVGGHAATLPGLGSSGAYIAGALGAALAVIALDWLVRGRIVAIGRDTVVVTVWSLLGRDVWHEPRADYRQIRVEREQWPHRYGPRSWYVVRLGHPDPGRAVELARAKDPGLIDRLARDYAGRLGLPLSWQRDELLARPSLERGGESAAAGGVAKPLSAT